MSENTGKRYAANRRKKKPPYDGRGMMRYAARLVDAADFGEVYNVLDEEWMGYEVAPRDVADKARKLADRLHANGKNVATDNEKAALKAMLGELREVYHDA